MEFQQDFSQAQPEPMNLGPNIFPAQPGQLPPSSSIQN